MLPAVGIGLVKRKSVAAADENSSPVGSVRRLSASSASPRAEAARASLFPPLGGLGSLNSSSTSAPIAVFPAENADQLARAVNFMAIEVQVGGGNAAGECMRECCLNCDFSNSFCLFFLLFFPAVISLGGASTGSGVAADAIVLSSPPPTPRTKHVWSESQMDELRSEYHQFYDPTIHQRKSFGPR
jgi:hypothetical protein